MDLEKANFLRSSFKVLLHRGILCVLFFSFSAFAEGEISPCGVYLNDRASVTASAEARAEEMIQRGYPRANVERLIKFDPAAFFSILSARPSTLGGFYRGMMINPAEYDPAQGTTYVSPELEVATRYARGGTFEERNRGLYRHYIFQLLFPTGVLTNGGRGKRQAWLTIFPIVDGRAFIHRVGYLDTEANSVQWYSYSEAFDENGRLRDLKPAAPAQ